MLLNHQKLQLNQKLFKLKKKYWNLMFLLYKNYLHQSQLSKYQRFNLFNNVKTWWLNGIEDDDIRQLIKVKGKNFQKTKI